MPFRGIGDLLFFSHSFMRNTYQIYYKLYLDFVTEFKAQGKNIQGFFEGQSNSLLLQPNYITKFSKLQNYPQKNKTSSLYILRFENYIDNNFSCRVCPYISIDMLLGGIAQ